MKRIIDINFQARDDGIDPGSFFDAARFAIPPKDDIARNLQAADAGDFLFVLTPPLYYSTANGIADSRHINDTLLGAAQDWHGLAFGVVEPKSGEATREEIARLAKAGAAGVVWSPRAQGVFANDGQMAQLLRLCHELGLVPMIHTEPFSINESLHRIWDLAAQCPDGPLVILGAFASWENLQAIQRAGRKADRVYYDTSGLNSTRDLEGMVQHCGADRCLFGSGGGREFDEALRIVMDCAFDAEARHAILSGNAARLLGLDT